MLPTMESKRSRGLDITFSQRNEFPIPISINHKASKLTKTNRRLDMVTPPVSYWLLEIQKEFSVAGTTTKRPLIVGKRTNILIYIYYVHCI